MKGNLVILALVCTALAMSGCQTPAPLSPDSPPDGLQPVSGRAVAPVAGTLTVTGVADPGDEFVTPGAKTRHIKGQVLTVALSGDLVGTGVFRLNTNGNTVRGNGGVSGPFTAEVTWQGMDGTFAGQLAGNLHEFVLTATFVARGTGEFAGLKWRATATGPLSGPVTYEGHILNPHGP